MTNPTHEQYRIRFSFNVYFKENTWGDNIPDAAFPGTGEIIRYNDEPYNLKEIYEEAKSIAEEKFFNIYGSEPQKYSITDISLWDFYKEEKLEDLDNFVESLKK